MRTISRRQLLKLGSASLASAVAIGGVHRGVAAAPSRDLLRVAILGVNGRGQQLLPVFAVAPGAKVIALCDPDSDILGQRADEFDRKQGGNVRRVANYRQILQDPGIDVVVVATPNHWHSLMTIEACQAGKHIYCEKPVCHSIWEGRQMVKAINNSSVFACAGFQNRSDTGLSAAIPWIRSGELGQITAVRGLCNRRRDSIGRTTAPTTPPASLDYDLWLGPAEDLPIMRPHVHYDWHWDWNTGNGDMGNQGPHEMDLIRWVLGDPGHPRAIRSVGGRFAWNDAGNTPNMQVASFDFGNGVPVVFEVRNLHNPQNRGLFAGGPEVGLYVRCEGGEYRGGRGGGIACDNDGKIVRKFVGDEGATHVARFIAAVRDNDRSAIPTTVESAFYSSCLSHLANISVRVGRTNDSADIAAAVDADPTMHEVLNRYSQQLSTADVDFHHDPWHVGPSLRFDPIEERFTQSERLADANSLLRREYRSPYAVPETLS